MNFAADRLNMWWADSRAVPAEGQLSFVDWRRASSGHRSPEEPYPPRAQVGRYLADGLARMCRRPPPGVAVRLRQTQVRAIDEHGGTWQVVDMENGIHEHDEVLVAVGHGTWHARPEEAEWRHAAPLVPAVFPVDRWMSPRNVPPGAVVAVRGFGLTFLDAAIALSEGRGGRFEADDHPYRLRYFSSHDDAGLILPFSRTGRPMLAKPEPELAASISALATIAQSASEEIVALREGFSLKDDLLEVLATSTAAILQAGNPRGQRGEARRDARRWLLAAYDGATPPTAEGAADEIERSLAVGHGMRPPDLQWALGETWRGAYPAVVARLSGSGMADRQWPAFRRLAAELERVAFGPPAINAAKLLALIAARRVDLTCVARRHIATTNERTWICTDGAEQTVDSVVNAVLPGPGLGAPDGGLLEQLVSDGHARVAAGRRGLEVASDLNCIGRSGRRAPGLSAIGRPTEDWVIGNDTLDRALHPQFDRWAHRVARQVRFSGATEVPAGRAI